MSKRDWVIVILGALMAVWISIIVLKIARFINKVAYKPPVIYFKEIE